MKTDPAAALAAARELLESDDPRAGTAMGGAISDEQVRYFERVIAEHPDVRWTFLFLHRPIWEGDGNPALHRIEGVLDERGALGSSEERLWKLRPAVPR